MRVRGGFWGLLLGWILFGAAVVCVGQAEEADARELFDGETLEGWRNPYDWGEVWVEDGVICLRGARKFFLVTEDRFGDFELSLEVQLPAEGVSNSGIMFRCHVGRNRVFGYQAECDPTERAWTGGLYDEGRRGWLAPRKGQEPAPKLVQAPRGTWMRYRIRAEGERLRIWIDGELTTDFRDGVDAEGHIGLQHHGERGQVYRFRNIRITELVGGEEDS